MHQLALELPERPVAGEGDVLASPGQQVCGHLRDKQPWGHPTAGQPHRGHVSVRDDAGDGWSSHPRDDLVAAGDWHWQAKCGP